MDEKVSMVFNRKCFPKMTDFSRLGSHIHPKSGSIKEMARDRHTSGRGQDHASNFCIVDLENFATASRRYTGDNIHNHNTSVVGGLFMTPILKRLDLVMVECTCLFHISPL